jgi:hypothetical protein
MSFRFNKAIYVALVTTIFSMALSVAGQVQPYRVTDRQVQLLISRIETRTDNFRRQVGTLLDNSNLNNTNREENINEFIGEFETATDRLRTNFTSRSSTGADVEEVLARAARIDRFVRNNNLNTRAQNQWAMIRTDLNTLATYYRVSWNWNDRNRNNRNDGNWGGNRGGSFDSRLTGTYRLNTSLSDNVSTAVDRALATGSYNANQGDRMRRNLERRLNSPEMIVIEKRGQDITLASSLSQQVTFSADNVSRSETTANGRTMQVRAAATGNDLTIDYQGDRMNDFYVSFSPVSNNQLRVTRRLYLENRNQTVTVTSVYDKVDNVARWNNITYPNTYPNDYPNTTGGNTGDFIIANNTRLTATLDTPLSTRNLRDGDRFTMTVSAPAQYRGAVIEGRVIGERSGVVSGRATMNLSFDSIRMNNNNYRFAGIVDQVREPDGDTVSINNEGAVRDSNQTTKTVTRAGIGAALGAIIGAIAGGGQGAAVGAAIGAGAGAGSVVLQGRDNLELPVGTEFFITATAPGNVRSYR